MDFNILQHINLPAILCVLMGGVFAKEYAAEIADLTVTVTGAVINDIVTIGIPNGSTTQGSYSAWVSSTDTVTVRFHNSDGGVYDPASNTFKIYVLK